MKKLPAIHFDTTPRDNNGSEAYGDFLLRVTRWNKAERRRIEARTQTWARGASKRAAAAE